MCTQLDDGTGTAAGVQHPACTTLALAYQRVHRALPTVSTGSWVPCNQRYHAYRCTTNCFLSAVWLIPFLTFLFCSIFSFYNKPVWTVTLYEVLNWCSVSQPLSIRGVSTGTAGGSSGSQCQS